jgi:hypothetical protein
VIEQAERDSTAVGWLLVPVQRPADAAALLELACHSCEPAAGGRHRAPDDVEQRSDRHRYAGHEGDRHRDGHRHRDGDRHDEPEGFDEADRAPRSDADDEQASDEDSDAVDEQASDEDPDAPDADGSDDD